MARIKKRKGWVVFLLSKLILVFSNQKKKKEKKKMKKGLILVPYVHADSPTKRLVNSVLEDGYHLCGKFEFFYFLFF